MLQIASGEVCSGEMSQRLANAFKDVDELINDLNHHDAHAQKVVGETFRHKSAPLAGRLQKYLQQVVAPLSISADEAACYAVESLHGDVAHCQSAM